MSNAAGIIFSNLNDNTLSRLTQDRTVAAIPFGCRYRLIDFALSNMVNAGITDVSVIANYNYRSLSEHIGSGKDWDLARREGGIRFVSPYKTSRTPKAAMYSFHLEALKNMMEFIREIKEDIVVLSDTDNILTIDLSEVINYHMEKGADVTIVSTPCKEDFTSKTSVMMVSADKSGHIQHAIRTKTYEAGYERSVNIFVMTTAYLISFLEEAIANNYNSLTQDLYMSKTPERNLYQYSFKGYVGPVSSFQDYYSHSIALATDASIRAELFGTRERPVYTRVHNSAPVAYLAGSSVKNSMIADGCIIEGTVENSVLFRGVHVGKGAVVRNSVLFSGTVIGDGSSINCVVADKDVTVSPRSTLSGAPTLPFFIGKSRNV